MQTIPMAGRFALALTAGALVASPLPFSAQPRPATTVVIRNVTVVSGDLLPPQRATVAIAGNRIAYVGGDAGAPASADARLIDGTGKFLAPGLIDMHVHVSKARGSALGLFVANGVTTVRDMGGDHLELLRWRAEVEAGTRLGPRLLIAGPYLESAGNVQRMTRQSVEEMAEPVEQTRVPVGSPADAARIVDELAGRVDHVKIRTVQNRETYLAIGEAARKHGLALVGHVYGLRPDDILLSGQRSIEHQFYPTLDGMAADQRVALFKRFAAAGIGVVPTMVTVTRSVFPSQPELQAIVDDDQGVLDPRRRYLSKYMLIDWREQVPEQTDARRAEARKVFASQVRDLRDMRQAGVHVFAGTDAAVLNVFPGSSMVEELELFVTELGMSPLDALRAATSAAAAFIGLGAEVGTVQAGRIADLVLLDADPTADIRNLRRIAAVILRGRVLDRAAIDRVLAEVSSAPDRRENDWPRTRQR